MYQFKDEYRTGIETIDSEHQKLFEIADRAYETLMNEFIPDKYDYIVEILNELKDYAAFHFRHEEEYMISIRYKRLISQKASHDEFIEKINSYDLSEIDAVVLHAPGTVQGDQAELKAIEKIFGNHIECTLYL